ncbi:MAG: DUF4363 family protein [Clostridia bacterium]|nr:DUF4363 family protein [Clostridia bacterium]
MKVFILAVMVFAIVVVCIFGGSLYVNRMCDRLLGLLENMGALEVGDLAGFGDMYSVFEEIWDRGEVWLHILVGHDAADAVEDMFVELGMRFIGRDELGYRVVMEKVSLQLEKIREGERVVVDSIM